jgi:hypothetical protein
MSAPPSTRSVPGDPKTGRISAHTDERGRGSGRAIANDKVAAVHNHLPAAFNVQFAAAASADPQPAADSPGGRGPVGSRTAHLDNSIAGRHSADLSGVPADLRRAAAQRCAPSDSQQSVVSAAHEHLAAKKIGAAAVQYHGAAAAARQAAHLRNRVEAEERGPIFKRQKTGLAQADEE